MQIMPISARFLRSVAAAVTIAAGSSPLSAQGAIPKLFESLAVFSSPRLRESSGVAVSRQHPGVLWTHNDSGNQPSVFAVDLEGRLLGELQLRGTIDGDWEDIALGTCTDETATCIYIADTGDNRETRRNVGLYITPEPLEFRGRRVAGARRVALKYPHGPRDVEALAIRRSGEALLVTKGRSGPIELYRISAEAMRLDTATVEVWTTLDIVPQRKLGRLVTGAAISENDEILAVRTYTELYFFRLATFPNEVTLEAACWLGAYEPQGEAVDFLDDSTLVMTSEGARGRPALLSRVRCPMNQEKEQP